MITNLKDYIYTHGKDAGLDAEFDSGTPYLKVKLGENTLFWKAALRWHAISLTRVQRIFRRVERVYGKMCCGRASFDMEKLVLILDDGAELELYLGDNVKTEAQKLLQALQDAHPELQYGKPEA